jgi:hypothetical protein
MNNGPHTYPASDWVRDVVFPDGRPNDDHGTPVHVCTKPVLVNGVILDARIARSRIYVTAGATEGTVLSMVVHEDDLTLPDYAAADRWDKVTVGGLKVLVPVQGDEHDWEVENVDEDTHETWWRVYIFVASVTFGNV